MRANKLNDFRAPFHCNSVLDGSFYSLSKEHGNRKAMLSERVAQHFHAEWNVEIIIKWRKMWMTYVKNSPTFLAFRMETVILRLANNATLLKNNALLVQMQSNPTHNKQIDVNDRECNEETFKCFYKFFISNHR